ncbi:MAG: type II toxin-antitoxin system VapC family toxin [Acidobacteriota bacterium]|nr:type II toxin-antitoxin system VapC family toxin [Acidobacteriota bacterium]
MSRIILDASALLAILNDEPGEEKLTSQPGLLSEAAISTVNLAEVQSKLVERGIAPEEAWQAALSPINQVLVFTREHARLAGDLLPKTRHLGLSLGDRACLAVGMTLKAPVYTADRDWKKLRLAVSIHVIR